MHALFTAKKKRQRARLRDPKGKSHTRTWLEIGFKNSKINTLDSKLLV
jgi:hypothetical protein